MLPDELEKVKLEIRDTKHKIAELEEGVAQTISLQKGVNQTYLEDFTDCASMTRKMA
jgi:phage shock protein A